MKLTKRAKLITLALLLAVLIAGGIFLVVYLANKDTAPPQASGLDTLEPSPLAAQVPEGMQVKYVKGEVTSRPHLRGFSGEFVNYKGKTVLYYDKKLLDLQTNETILELPKSVFADYVWAVYVDDNDQIYTISSKEAPGKLLFSQYTPNGKLVGEQVELQESAAKWFVGKNSENDNFVHFWYFAVDAERIYLTSWSLDSIFQMFDRDGSMLMTQETSYGAALSGGKLYLSGKMGEGMQATRGFGRLDPSTLQWDYVTNITEYAFGLVLDEQNGVLYAPTEIGIETFSAEDGKPLEEVFNTYKDGEMVTSGRTLKGFAMDTSGNLYFRSWQQENDIFLADEYLNYERTIVDKIEQPVTLTISDSWRSEYVEELILRFEQQYPDEKVSYSYMYDSHGEARYGSYDDRLAEQLLAGDAADLVMLGGYRSTNTDVIQSNFIADLTPYLEKEFNSADYDETLLAALGKNGLAKVFPINFYMPAIQVDVNGLRELGVETDFEKITWSELLSLVDVVAEKAPEKALFSSKIDNWKAFVMPEILRELLFSNVSDLIDKETHTVDLHQEWFVDLIKQLKAVLESPNGIKHVPLENHDSFQDQAYVRVERGDAFFETYGVDKLYRPYYVNIKPGSNIRYYPIPTGEKSVNRAAYSWTLYGITEKSEHKESAWKFLNFAIKQENQGLYSHKALPVNKSAWPSWITPSEVWATEEVTQPHFDDLTRLYQNIDTIYGADKLTMDVYNPILQYLNDEISLEEALKIAEQSVWIRVNE